MSRSYADRKKLFQSTAESAPVTDGAVKRQLSLAAGTEAFQNRDPIYHLTESFRQTFDMMGQQRAKGEQPDLDAARAVYMRDETPGLSGFDEAESSKEEPKQTPMTGFSEEFLPLQCPTTVPRLPMKQDTNTSIQSSSTGNMNVSWIITVLL